MRLQIGPGQPAHRHSQAPTRHAPHPGGRAYVRVRSGSTTLTKRVVTLQLLGAFNETPRLRRRSQAPRSVDKLRQPERPQHRADARARAASRYAPIRRSTLRSARCVWPATTAGRCRTRRWSRCLLRAALLGSRPGRVQRRPRGRTLCSESRSSAIRPRRRPAARQERGERIVSAGATDRRPGGHDAGRLGLLNLQNGVRRVARLDGNTELCVGHPFAPHHRCAL